jgi:hypothetical protein
MNYNCLNDMDELHGQVTEIIVLSDSGGIFWNNESKNFIKGWGG